MEQQKIPHIYLVIFRWRQSNPEYTRKGSIRPYLDYTKQFIIAAESKEGAVTIAKNRVLPNLLTNPTFKASCFDQGMIRKDRTYYSGDTFCNGKVEEDYESKYNTTLIESAVYYQRAVETMAQLDETTGSSYLQKLSSNPKMQEIYRLIAKWGHNYLFQSGTNLQFYIENCMMQEFDLPQEAFPVFAQTILSRKQEQEEPAKNQITKNEPETKKEPENSPEQKENPDTRPEEDSAAETENKHDKSGGDEDGSSEEKSSSLEESEDVNSSESETQTESSNPKREEEPMDEELDIQPPPDDESEEETDVDDIKGAPLDDDNFPPDVPDDI